MYYASIETNAAKKKQHDDNLNQNAKDRLAFNAAKKKNASKTPVKVVEPEAE